MDKNLTTSGLHRKNILNNSYALLEIEKEVAFPGIPFEATIKYTKKQIADFYEIDVRTIERYIDQHEEELLANGYEVLSGKRLKVFKEVYAKVVVNAGERKPNNGDVTDIDVGDISRAPFS